MNSAFAACTARGTSPVPTFSPAMRPLPSILWAMPKPVADWDESDVLALPAAENSFERKGSRSLDLTSPATQRMPKVKEGDVLDELAKQLSAFSNTGGGQIIYGVANDGTVENGGVPLSVKGNQSTKDWLEDVIPKLTEFEIVGFHVYEIKSKSATSPIAHGKAIFVIEVPESDRAPHQSARDQKYYVRLGGKSQPAPHRLIEDIRNRQKHPLLEISEIRLQITDLPVSVEPIDLQATIDGETRITLNISVQNAGPIMARNACLRLDGSEMSLGWRDYDNHSVRRRGQTSPAFWEFLDPIYPGMKIGLWVAATVPACYVPASGKAPFGGPWLVDRKRLADTRLSWWLFADNAPVRQGEMTVEDLGFENAAKIAVDKHPRNGLIRHTYRLL